MRSRLTSYLPGELLKDVAPMGVQNGDGLGEVMSLLEQIIHEKKVYEYI